MASKHYSENYCSPLLITSKQTLWLALLVEDHIANEDGWHVALFRSFISRNDSAELTNSFVAWWLRGRPIIWTSRVFMNFTNLLTVVQAYWHDCFSSSKSISMIMFISIYFIPNRKISKH
jgi:hypothetical protein